MRGCASTRARSGPMPTTSTRTPGKTSSASISVLMPLSAISGPTNRAPTRASLMRRPAPDPVLDLRRALGFVLEGGVWFINLYLDLARLHLRPRLFLRGFGFVFVARAPPAQSARGVEVSGGGCGSTHVEWSP